MKHGIRSYVNCCFIITPGAFGEGMMHPVDTLKTRLQSQIIMNPTQRQKSIPQMLRTVWVGDGLKGDTVGSFVYVPCEVIKQRMQIQGTSSSWSSFISRKSVPVKPRGDMYGYYTGMFQAGCSIWKVQGPKGLYAGYWSTLARDVPFAVLMVSKTVTSVHLMVLCLLIVVLFFVPSQVMFYEALKDLTDERKKKFPQFVVNSSVEGLDKISLKQPFQISAYLTTPLDCCKNKIASARNNDQGWLDADCSGSDMEEGRSRGFFQGKRPKGHVVSSSLGTYIHGR
ncbi:unnamed protein product [Brassica napus]|uniref:(rape) hypothetical protein n=1 Tax=Brassica napus TaxID=3708 RepID=A0A816WY16_BRANA|nr:unnamed protein product [Brassica napus]